MKIYLVGGYCRDTILGVIPRDKDYVVLGSTPEEMITLGYKQVASGFPIFLHPTTGEEYALARSEKKNNIKGYYGFDVKYDPSVTLEEDLKRRDISANSLAMDLDTGEIIDPFNGRADIKAGIIRHTSEAFSDDVIRVLRVCRFTARYNWKIAPETKQLMKKIVNELNSVPQERIWMEFEKGLMEKYPERMVEELRECGAFEVQAMKPYAEADSHALSKISESAGLDLRFLLICAGFKDDDYERCRIPNDCVAVAKAFNKNIDRLHKYQTLTSAERLQVLESMRALNDQSLIMTCLSGMMFYQISVHSAAVIMLTSSQIDKDITRAKSIDAAKIAAQCKNGNEIRQRIFNARVTAMDCCKATI